MQADDRPRRYYVARLPQEKHDLLRDLRKWSVQETDRYGAFLQLAPYIQALEDEDFPVEVLDPIRLAIPAEIDQLLKVKSKAIDKSYLKVLIRAAEKWTADRQAEREAEEREREADKRSRQRRQRSRQRRWTNDDLTI